MLLPAFPVRATVRWVLRAPIGQPIIQPGQRFVISISGALSESQHPVHARQFPYQLDVAHGGVKVQYLPPVALRRGHTLAGKRIG